MYIVLLLVFLMVLFIFFAIRNSRIDKAEAFRRKLGLQDPETDDYNIVVKPKVIDKLEQVMLRAGILMPVYRFLGYSLLVCGGFFTLGIFITRNIIIAFVLGVAGLIAIWVVLRGQAAKRKARFEAQLEAIITMLSASLRAGASLAQAIGDVADADEVSDPASTEFKLMAREIGMGIPASDALHRSAERLDGEDLHILATAATVQSRAGGNLPEILDNLVATVRDRKALRSSLKAITAEGKMSGIVIGAIPFFVTGAILLISPGYFSPMMQSPGGRLVFVGAFVMIIIGWFIIRRISSTLYY